MAGPPHVCPGVRPRESERMAGMGLSRPGPERAPARFAPFLLSRMISMNSKFVSAAAIAAAPAVAPATSPPGPGDALVAAAHRLLADLERGRAIDARALRVAMIACFGG